MPIPSYTGKQSLGTQIIFIKDGDIFSEEEGEESTPVDIGAINDETKHMLAADDSIEYSHASLSPDQELQRFLDEKY